MKIDKLPEEVKLMAINNRANCWLDKHSNDLYAAFDWDDSPEGFDFWADVHCAETLEEVEEAKKRYNI